MQQLGVELGAEGADMPVHFGGPVEASRGFVLHTTDYVQDSTLVIDQEIGLTATVDMLKVIAAGGGPRISIPGRASVDGPFPIGGSVLPKRGKIFPVTL